jgi:hypothetical protein
VFNLESLAHHPGIIYLPYTYGTANFYEMYTMAIPMFCPSLALLERRLPENSVATDHRGATQCSRSATRRTTEQLDATQSSATRRDTPHT